MASVPQNYYPALKACEEKEKEAAYKLAALVTISDNLAEINESLKDIKHALRMMDRNAHGSDY